MITLKEEMLEKLTDDDLIKVIIASGETEHFGILYNRYANKVFRKCLTMLKNDTVAQDLSHDILIKAFLSLANFKGKSKFSSWIYAITYNQCIDYLRKQRRYQNVELGDNMDITVDDESTMIKMMQEVRISRLKELMYALSEEDRIILLMKYQDELSIKEIEATLNIKQSAVKMRLKRARERLEKLYRSNYKDDL